jgi:hypothetical protein
VILRPGYAPVTVRSCDKGTLRAPAGMNFKKMLPTCGSIPRGPPVLGKNTTGLDSHLCPLSCMPVLIVHRVLRLREGSTSAAMNNRSMISTELRPFAIPGNFRTICNSQHAEHHPRDDHESGERQRRALAGLSHELGSDAHLNFDPLVE